MKVKKDDSQRRIIRPLAGDPAAAITIDRLEQDGKGHAAISWTGAVDLTPESAEEFARGLLQAVGEARDMEHEQARTEPPEGSRASRGSTPPILEGSGSLPHETAYPGGSPVEASVAATRRASHPSAHVTLTQAMSLLGWETGPMTPAHEETILAAAKGFIARYGEDWVREHRAQVRRQLEDLLRL